MRARRRGGRALVGVGRGRAEGGRLVELCALLGTPPPTRSVQALLCFFPVVCVVAVPRHPFTGSFGCTISQRPSGGDLVVHRPLLGQCCPSPSAARPRGRCRSRPPPQLLALSRPPALHSSRPRPPSRSVVRPTLQRCPGFPRIRSAGHFRFGFRNLSTRVAGLKRPPRGGQRRPHPLGSRCTPVVALPVAAAPCAASFAGGGGLSRPGGDAVPTVAGRRG